MLVGRAGVNGWAKVCQTPLPALTALSAFPALPALLKTVVIPVMV